MYVCRCALIIKRYRKQVDFRDMQHKRWSLELMMEGLHVHNSHSYRICMYVYVNQSQPQGSLVPMQTPLLRGKSGGIRAFLSCAVSAVI